MYQVSEAFSTTAVVEAIEHDHGPITIAVLNAGTHADMPASAFDAQEVAKIYALNMTGMANGLDPLLKRFLPRGAGQIALTASVAGFRGLPRAGAYCARAHDSPVAPGATRLARAVRVLIAIHVREPRPVVPAVPRARADECAHARRVGLGVLRLRHDQLRCRAGPRGLSWKAASSGYRSR